MHPRVSRPVLGKYFSEGARLLWLRMVERGWSQTELASHIGTSSGQVNQWLYGRRRPSLKWAPPLRDALGIELETWHQEPSEPFEPPGRDDSGSLPEDADAVAETGT